MTGIFGALHRYKAGGGARLGEQEARVANGFERPTQVVLGPILADGGPLAAHGGWPGPSAMPMAVQHAELLAAERRQLRR